ncbi:class I SAM-dependent methyltransferase [Solicola gregarius]|uniref:Class I SAM-dependent methyltransferase n=1 Tax=Solicola gregarius TaxID=2908642 RepID=A0AA46TL13_9ACTN|nr:class I SAM-dependent methyltransferase [Solicola gregarius]UYM07236.1 class I SAM-dependent methyltransferase [Solicola gregarius]
MTDHHARIVAAFTEQAETFQDPHLNTAFTSALDWLVDLIDPAPHDAWLDVAAGTGLVGRTLARRVGRVLCVDATEAMLEAGRNEAAGDGIHNVDFVLGDALDLPVAPGSFDGAVTRFSFHHLEEPRAALATMVDACRPGGRIVVKDLIASAEPGVREQQDRIEALRDDSHLRMALPGEIADWGRELGLEVEAPVVRELDRPLEPWLAQSCTPPDRSHVVREALTAELDRGERTGMRPHRRGSELWFRQTWEVTLATRPG